MNYKVVHKNYNYPDQNGFFGEFGGAFVDEKFKSVLANLEKNFNGLALKFTKIYN